MGTQAGWFLVGHGTAVLVPNVIWLKFQVMPGYDWTTLACGAAMLAFGLACVLLTRFGDRTNLPGGSPVA